MHGVMYPPVQYHTQEIHCIEKFPRLLSPVPPPTTQVPADMGCFMDLNPSFLWETGLGSESVSPVPSLRTPLIICNRRSYSYFKLCIFYIFNQRKATSPKQWPMLHLSQTHSPVLGGDDSP